MMVKGHGRAEPNQICQAITVGSLVAKNANRTSMVEAWWHGGIMQHPCVHPRHYICSMRVHLLTLLAPSTITGVFAMHVGISNHGQQRQFLLRHLPFRFTTFQPTLEGLDHHDNGVPEITPRCHHTQFMITGYIHAGYFTHLKQEHIWGKITRIQLVASLLLIFDPKQPTWDISFQNLSKNKWELVHYQPPSTTASFLWISHTTKLISTYSPSFGLKDCHAQLKGQRIGGR